jgi:hypothetical protein
MTPEGDGSLRLPQGNDWFSQPSHNKRLGITVFFSGWSHMNVRKM